MSNLIIITVATKSDGYLPALKHHLVKNKIKHQILGYGQKWGGWIWRINIIMDYLRKCQPNDIVMIIDGYDIIVKGTEDSILRKYREFNTDIVFGVHYSDITDYSFVHKTINIAAIKQYFKTNNKYVMNGGSFMGSVEGIYEIYRRILMYNKKTGIKDDQIALNNISLKGLNYELDTMSKIFWIWDTNTVYEIMYDLIYKEYPPYKGSFVLKNRTPEFSNGESPEVIHGVGHRNMSMFVDTDIRIKHKPRVYVQNDIESSRNIGSIIAISILIMLYFKINPW